MKESVVFLILFFKIISLTNISSSFSLNDQVISINHTENDESLILTIMVDPSYNGFIISLYSQLDNQSWKFMSDYIVNYKPIVINILLNEDSSNIFTFIVELRSPYDFSIITQTTYQVFLDNEDDSGSTPQGKDEGSLITNLITFISVLGAIIVTPLYQLRLRKRSNPIKNLNPFQKRSQE